MSRHWNEGDKVGAFVLLKRAEDDDTRTQWEARCKCSNVSVVVPGNVLRRSKVRPATCRPCCRSGTV